MHDRECSANLAAVDEGKLDKDIYFAPVRRTQPVAMPLLLSSGEITLADLAR